MYKIECHYLASHAAKRIDPELGKGHSNLCEFTLSPVTNPGLIQSHMTYMYLYSRRGSHYHWVLDLYTRMGLPEVDGMKEFGSN